MKRRFLTWLATKLLVIGARRPYKHLFHDDGTPYMRRYWLLKLGRGQMIDGEVMPRWLGVRLHMICSSDDDRAYHDHPWWFCTWILVGGYIEHRPALSAQGVPQPLVNPADNERRYRVGAVLFRRASSWHRLELPPGTTAITLFIHGPRRQGWGYLRGGRKIPWRDFDGSDVHVVNPTEKASA